MVSVRMEAHDAQGVQLEPEQAFGEYDAGLLRVEPAERYGEGLAVGMQVEEGDTLYTVTDVAGGHRRGSSPRSIIALEGRERPR